ncbi:MAG: hypothetical protein MKZ81_04340 [Dehalococcoidia bacterium]|nr:hypothetical protein [Dehalococcoidia bacterium]
MEESSLQFFLGLTALAWGIFTGWRNSKQPENINEEQSEQKKSRWPKRRRNRWRPLIWSVFGIYLIVMSFFR